METPGYTTVLDQDRGYCDYIPFDIAYIPSLFSVSHQMAKYGIAREDGDGYQFEQLYQPVFEDVEKLLKELGVNAASDFYILKLHPKWRNHSTTIIVTNSCLFVDEDEWCKLGNSLFVNGFKAEIKKKGWNVADPVRTVKRYLLKRALSHYKRGSYRKKVASKLVVGAILGFAMYKTMPAITGYIAKQDTDLGITKAIGDSAPTLTNVCTTLCIPSILKFVGSGTIFSIIASEIGGLLHKFTTAPLWAYMDRKAEEDAVGSEKDTIKKVIAGYNSVQRTVNNNNNVLRSVYDRRCKHIASMVKKHQ